MARTQSIRIVGRLVCSWTLYYYYDSALSRIMSPFGGDIGGGLKKHPAAGNSRGVIRDIACRPFVCNHMYSPKTFDDPCKIHGVIAGHHARCSHDRPIQNPESEKEHKPWVKPSLPSDCSLQMRLTYDVNSNVAHRHGTVILLGVYILHPE